MPFLWFSISSFTNCFSCQYNCGYNGTFIFCTIIAILKNCNQLLSVKLRYLQTLNNISAEKNSTIVFPVPIDIITHFMNGQMHKQVAEMGSWALTSPPSQASWPWPSDVAEKAKKSSLGIKRQIDLLAWISEDPDPINSFWTAGLEYKVNKLLNLKGCKLALNLP